MSNAEKLPPITANELLARFITEKKWVRADHTVRQDAFIPPRDLNLSVTRHLKLSEEKLWNLGQKVVVAIAEKRSAALCGRADLTVREVSLRNLKTEPAALPKNPNHAHITGWPLDKAAQKNIAQQLAAAAKFMPKPGAQEMPSP